ISLPWLGMAVTLGGVVWGVLDSDRREIPSTGAGAHRMRGLSLAGAGMLLQSLSVVVSKRGIAGTVTPVEATLIRVCAGLAGFAVLIALTGRIGRVRAGVRNRAAMAQLSLGAAVGPVLGVVLMMRALQQVPSGIAQTVLATTPVLIIPLSAILHQERITPARVCASLLALAGVALLFLA
ncbi:MAG: DMT family transporter, partial [Kiritimatiellae bacterium]|nr:DMT family transporter [Kiritimatiellia bacterium]